MSHVPEFTESLLRFILFETTIQIHLISEDAVYLDFGKKNRNTDCTFDETLPIAISALTAYFKKTLNSQHTIITDTIASYNSVLLIFNLELIRGEVFKNDLDAQIKELFFLANHIEQQESKNTGKVENSKVIKIPAYYGLDVGWDLHELSREKNISIDKIIEIHSKKLYTVCAIGFSPGFAFMGFVSPKIQKKRLNRPRTRVFPGSIGIAEDQTGIYPNVSPGGWNIIGRTPKAILDLGNECNPSLFSIGDTVRFVPIDKQTYLELGGVINTK